MNHTQKRANNATTPSVFVCPWHSNTISNHRWAATSPWQISTCVWDQCCCTCESSPWSHSLCTITHHLRHCLNDWLTGGRISLDKTLKWLITEAHLSTWGCLAYRGPWAPGEWISPRFVHLTPCSKFPNTWIHVVSLTVLCVYASCQPKTYTVSPGVNN